MKDLGFLGIFGGFRVLGFLGILGLLGFLGFMLHSSKVSSFGSRACNLGSGYSRFYRLGSGTRVSGFPKGFKSFGLGIKGLDL